MKKPKSKKRGYSKIAIAAFILSIFSILLSLLFVKLDFSLLLPLLVVLFAIILNIAGGVICTKNNLKGKTLAITGLIISILNFYQLFMVAFGW